MKYCLLFNRATVVVMSETASINIIFAFSQRWSFHYLIWPTYTSVACDTDDMF